MPYVPSCYPRNKATLFSAPLKALKTPSFSLGLLPPKGKSSRDSSDNARHTASYKSHVYYLLTPFALSFTARFLLYVLVFSFLVTHAYAQPTSSHSSFDVCALNANRLVSPAKLACVGPLLASLLPRFFALSEMKTTSSVAPNLPVNRGKYELFEEKGIQCASSQRGKWGVILGIHRDVQIITRVPLAQESLKG